MSDYKLVPVEPTNEMLEAAEEAYYTPFGDLEMALRMAILSARPVEQPAPDVTQLVLALEWIARVDCKPGRGDTDFAVAMDRGIAIGNIRRKAESALAAYES